MAGVAPPLYVKQLGETKARSGQVEKSKLLLSRPAALLLKKCGLYEGSDEFRPGKSLEELASLQASFQPPRAMDLGPSLV